MYNLLPFEVNNMTMYIILILSFGLIVSHKILNLIINFIYMMIKSFLKILLFFLFVHNFIMAQDTLFKDEILKDEYTVIKELLKKNDFNGVVEKSKILIKSAIKKNNKVALSYAYQIEGTGWQFLGFTDSAIFYHQKSLKGFIDNKDDKNIANSKSHLGHDYLNLAKYDLSVKYFFESLKYFDKTKNEDGLANAYNGLGNLNYYQNNMKKAEEYYLKASISYKKLNNLIAIAYIENNLGSLFLTNMKIDTGIKHINKALEIFEKLNNKKGIGMVSSGIGSAFYLKKDYKKALMYYFKSLDIDKEFGNKIGEGQTLLNISSSYYELNNNREAEKFGLQSLKIFENIKDLDNSRANFYSLYKIYSKDKNFKKALDYYIKYKISNDSLSNFETSKLINQNEIQYEYNKKALADSIKNIESQKIKDAQIQNQELQIKQEQTQRYALYGGLAIVLIGSGFIYNRFKITNLQNRIIEKQKFEVESQKDLLELKSKEIIDSMIYAKRLQEAILPPINFINQFLPLNFIFYKPKDIVAGDFYWMETITNKVNNKDSNISSVLFAVGDCTGHGVPGALVSVVCSNALNRSVLEFGLSEPGKILDKTRDLVLETFSKSSSDVKDGMDISLLSINNDSNDNFNEGIKIIQWAGANNPLWYFSNGIMNEIKADKQPIGKTDNPSPFKTHTLNLKKGDTLFLFTDGFADQFGGPKGKKFKHKQLKELLIENINMELKETEKVLENEFYHWKINLEQVDDVCIIGIRL